MRFVYVADRIDLSLISFILKKSKNCVCWSFLKSAFPCLFFKPVKCLSEQWLKWMGAF